MGEKAKYAVGLVLASMALAVLAAPGAAVASSTPPTITSEGASQITTSNAVLEAAIDIGSAETTYYQFQIAEDPSELPKEMQCPPRRICNGPQSSTALPIRGTFKDTTVELDLTKGANLTLKPGTTYYYRVLAANAIFSEDIIEWEEPTVFGETKSFTTETAPPTITSEGATAITATDATLEATIDPGSEEGAYYQFQIAEDPSEFAEGFQCTPGEICAGPHSEPVLPIGYASSEKTAKLDLAEAEATLEPGTTYYYRVLAANKVFSEDSIEWEEPTVFGETKSFTTETAPPTITSEGASQITATDATLEATIDPGSSKAGTYYQFQIAKDPSEFAEEMQCPAPGRPFARPCGGTYSETALPIGFIENEKTVELDLAKAEVTLEPGTTYYYRVLAANAVLTEDTIAWEEPTVFGETKSFTTKTEAPAITAEGASQITTGNAVLKATIDPGSSKAGTYYQFQIAKDPSEFAEEMQSSGLPIGHVALEAGETTVELDLAKAGVPLKPGTTYYFRVLAANAVPSEETIEWEEPTVFGEAQSFTTSVDPPTSDPEEGPVVPPPPGPEPETHHHHHHHHHHHGHVGNHHAGLFWARVAA